jgi:pimeloyl-ACP methyl ester carboxylesterase
MTIFGLASAIGQTVVVFALVLTAMIIFGRRRPPVPLQSMNDSALQKLAVGPDVELKTFGARDGTRLAYREFPGGRGQIAILIHGSTADGRAMQALGHSLAEQSISAYALDMRGHGVSGRRGDIDYVGQLEDDVADFVKHLRITHPYAKLALIGHSSGGGFSLRLACGKYATLFDRYVLAAPFIHHAVPTTRPGSGGWARPFMPRIIALTILDVMGLKLFQHLHVLAFAVPEGRSDLTGFYSFRLQSNFRPDTMKWKAQISNLQRPVDVIVGENDELFVANSYATLLKPLTPHISVQVLPGLGHLDIYSNPTAMNAISSYVRANIVD